MHACTAIRQCTVSSCSNTIITRIALASPYPSSTFLRRSSKRLLSINMSSSFAFCCSASSSSFCSSSAFFSFSLQHTHHSFISIQPPGRFGRNQSPLRGLIWLWHAASWASFLGVGCHCFPPPLDVPTFVTRCLHVRNNARDPSSERWNYGRECCPVILPK